MKEWLRVVGRGAMAGAVAALPMGAIQVGSYYAGLMGTVPPARITRSLFGALGLKPRSRLVRNAAVAVNHIGYAKLMGSGYALAEQWLRPKGSPILRGAGYGLAVWAFGYAGWVPAAGILPPPHRARKAGVAANIVAHAVYGGVVGWLVSRGHRPA